jgi:hypothetical protein
MTQNVGKLDRAIRLLAGFLLILLPLLTSFAAATPWLWWASLAIGAVLVVTGLAGTCPAYRVLGLSTCATGRRRA